MVSVCTGAFVLAEAGLLTGRRVTTHWAACETLAQRFPLVEVDPEPIFVRDGNVATSAGVTAGIDLALELARRLAGDDVAREIQLQLEYDPAPSLDSGSPEAAPPELVSRLRARARRYR